MRFVEAIEAVSFENILSNHLQAGTGTGTPQRAKARVEKQGSVKSDHALQLTRATTG